MYFNLQILSFLKMYHIVPSFLSRKRRPGKLYRQVTVCRQAFRGCCSAVDAFLQPPLQWRGVPLSCLGQPHGMGGFSSTEGRTGHLHQWVLVLAWGLHMKPDPSFILMCESSCQLHLPSCLPRLSPPIPSARIYSLSTSCGFQGLVATKLGS